MALFDSQLISRGSGSIGGLTLSHNKGGNYIRARTTPTNPSSIYQQTVRNAVQQLAARWSDTLTEAQRVSWEVYAANVLLPGPLGNPRNVGGIAMYVRSNVPIIQTGGGGGTVIDTAPAIFNLGSMSETSIAAISAATDQLSLNFEATDDWANENDSTLLVYTSRPQNQSINYFTGPYRFAGSIDGDSVTPPTSPASINLAFQVEVDQKVFIQIRVIRADGRLTSPFQDVAVVTT